MEIPEPTIYDLHSFTLETFLVAIEEEMERDPAGWLALDNLRRRVRDAQVHARAREASTN